MSLPRTPQPGQAAPAPRTQAMVNGLAVTRRRPEDPVGTVVLVHGAMDRAASFGRSTRRLEEFDVVAYDRRGYAGSTQVGAARALSEHVDDLRSVCGWAREHTASGTPLVVVGHSLGGLIALLLAAEVGDPSMPAHPVAVGAYEPPMPWKTAADGQLPGNAALDVAHRDGPSAAAEFFYRAMVGDAVWERLGDASRRDRLAEGPALVSDLEHSREPAAQPDPASISTAVHLCRGQRSSGHLREVTGMWADHLGVAIEELRGSGHGAHLSHPGEFAGWVSRISPSGGN